MHTVPTSIKRVLGKNLAVPLVRRSRDFETAEGLELLRQMLLHVVGIDKGELRWDPSFGAGLRKYVHRKMDKAMIEVIREQLLRELNSRLAGKILVQSVAIRPDKIIEGRLIVRIKWVPYTTQRTEYRQIDSSVLEVTI